eukprot:superscaffoldBa00003573_g17254
MWKDWFPKLERDSREVGYLTEFPGQLAVIRTLRLGLASTGRCSRERRAPSGVSFQFLVVGGWVPKEQSWFYTRVREQES